jgi:hypothetical protein
MPGRRDLVDLASPGATQVHEHPVLSVFSLQLGVFSRKLLVALDDEIAYAGTADDDAARDGRELELLHGERLSYLLCAGPILDDSSETFWDGHIHMIEIQEFCIL